METGVGKRAIGSLGKGDCHSLDVTFGVKDHSGGRLSCIILHIPRICYSQLHLESIFLDNYIDDLSHETALLCL